MSAADPKRRYGMDHGLYAWSMLERRPPFAWPGGKRIALWINVAVEHFPLDATGRGFKAQGSMTMPYPDLRHYTLRDYGNRIGIYRVLEALAARGMAASLAVQGEVVERYPALARHLAQSGHEWIGHGWNMDRVHFGGLPEEEERALIARSLESLRRHAPNPIQGWLSPARSQSFATPRLLAEAGIRWCGDWVNDEQPYPTSTGLIHLPLSHELEDRFVILENLHAESEWAEQVEDACEFLIRESREQPHPRVLSLGLHAWVIGHAHRIRSLERVLDRFQARAAYLWNATPSAIVAHWQAEARPG
ncbi:MAG: polysaccharide deacetylase family protein [Xanthomonadales bacterium]|nr:polysaccharide deacetylase family protein [Xanthomonadales bacterium]